MDNRMDNWGGQEMSLEEAAKMLRALSEADDLSPERRQQILDEQNKAVKMAGILLTGVNKLHDKLKSAKSAGEMREHLDHFYGKLPTFMNHFGLSLEDSDAMKLLYGIHNEFMNILPEGNGPDSREVLSGKKVEELTGFYVNFSTALQNVNYYRDWNSLERSVTDLISVTGVEEDELGELNMDLELLDLSDHDGVRGLIATKESLESKPISGVLERFAYNETDLEDLARVAEIWKRVKTQVESLLYGDDESN